MARGPITRWRQRGLFKEQDLTTLVQSLATPFGDALTLFSYPVFPLGIGMGKPSPGSFDGSASLDRPCKARSEFKLRSLRWKRTPRMACLKDTRKKLELPLAAGA